jgi:hypothetical protein
MGIITHVYDEYYPELEELIFVGTDESDNEVTLPRALVEIIDFDKLALCVPTSLWPKSWRDRYDDR